ncbi:transporter substrate-binding domain-containing protein [Marinobacter nanhaiticus D15-8W]|nr:ABC transporter substrate-binding protein [Marinobacter nanhaiticus]BES71461.1 transporter substrate-binding domain-containing protein [Marinobacter nanhaiticus D15-8W]
MTSTPTFAVVAREDGQAADIESAQQVTLWYRNYDSPAIRALLDLALRKTPEYGPYLITRSQEMNQGRALRELSNDNGHAVQVANVATTPERENNLLAVTIPIDGGLLGYRVCVTTPQMLSRFEGITRLADLRAGNIRFGQGRHWPDTQILEANGLKVVTHTRYESLFDMLAGGRFECFARGVSEVVYDLDLRQDDGLVIEPDLLFTYPMPSYFFVGRSDMALAMRIQLGLERAIVDGSFLKYLAHYFTRPLEELQLSNRRVFQLGNPWLPGGEKGISEDVLQHMKVRIQLGDKAPPVPN